MHGKTAANVLLLMLVTAAAGARAGAQTPVLVDIRGLSFHEVREQGLSVASPQEVTIEATGAESTSGNQFTSWLPAAWRGDPQGPRPWSGRQ